MPAHVAGGRDRHKQASDFIPSRDLIAGPRVDDAVECIAFVAEPVLNQRLQSTRSGTLAREYIPGVSNSDEHAQARLADDQVRRRSLTSDQPCYS